MSILLPENFNKTKVDLLYAYTPEDSLEELRNLASSKGGKCISEVYLGTQSSMQWQCKEGHQWIATANRIKRGSWCPVCAGTIKLTINEMKELAKIHNGFCISNEYINNNTALMWKCNEGHKFSARPDNVKSGTWCPKCRIQERANLQRSDIKEMQFTSQKRNGKCISTEYKTTHYKLTWECEQGHQWDASPSSIKRGSWCPTCAGHIKPSIEDMREIAIAKEGKCLSEKYISTHSKLLWECKKGHQWEARPSGIKRGNWCPTCGNKNRKSR